MSVAGGVSVLVAGLESSAGSRRRIASVGLEGLRAGEGRISAASWHAGRPLCACVCVSGHISGPVFVFPGTFPGIFPGLKGHQTSLKIIPGCFRVLSGK